MNQEAFEREFHSRTLAYQPRYKTDQRPVVVHLGDDAKTANGHLLLVALINQLARAHQHIVIPGATDIPLLCPSPSDSRRSSKQPSASRRPSTRL